MRTALCAVVTVVLTIVMSACFTPPTDEFRAEDIVATERAALDRWGRGDPQGFLDIMAPEVTYFDPLQEKRIEGLDAMKAMLAPIAGKVKIDRYEMIDPRVQRRGEMAALTFNLISYQRQADGSEKAVSRWNSTEIYGRIDGRWRIVHSHWSYVKPELKQAAPVG